MIRRIAEKLKRLAEDKRPADGVQAPLPSIFSDAETDEWKKKRDKRRKCDFDLAPNVREIAAALKKNLEKKSYSSGAKTGADSTVPTPGEYDPGTGDGKVYPGVYGRDSEWRERKKKNDTDVMKETKQEKAINDNQDPDSATGKGNKFQGPYGRDSEWREKKVSYYKKKVAERLSTK